MVPSSFFSHSVVACPKLECDEGSATWTPIDSTSDDRKIAAPLRCRFPALSRRSHVGELRRTEARDQLIPFAPTKAARLEVDRLAYEPTLDDRKCRPGKLGAPEAVIREGLPS